MVNAVANAVINAVVSGQWGLVVWFNLFGCPPLIVLLLGKGHCCFCLLFGLGFGYKVVVLVLVFSI